MNRFTMLPFSAILLFTTILCSGAADVHAGIGSFVFRQITEAAPKAMEAGRRIVGKYADDAFRSLSAFEKELIRGGTKARVAGRQVVKRNQTFDPNARDALGRTNTQRMREGFAPIGKDGRPVELHHMGQKNDGLIVEITSTQHRANSADLHRYRNKSEIDRQRFNEWKKEYWKKRAEDFR